MRPIRSSLALVLTAVVMCFSSCQKTPEPDLSVSRSEFSLDARGGYISVSVTTNVKLSVNIQGDWITIDGISDGGSGTYGFKVDFNKGYDSRTGSITFSNSENGLSQTVTVTQAQQDVIIPGSNEYSLFYEAQTFSLPISSNVEFTVSVDGGDWIESLGTRGLSKKELQFSIAENAGKEPREATITVTSGDLNQIIKVEQLATTHKPNTKEEWVTSITLNNEINKDKKEVFTQFEEDGITDVNQMAEALAEIDGVIDVLTNSDGSVISVMQKDSIWMDIFLETPRINTISFSTEDNHPFSHLTKSPDKGTTAIPSTRASSSNSIVKNRGKALVLSPFQWDLHYPTETWFDTLSDFFDVVLVQNSTETAGAASIDYFKGTNLDDYDFIIILTHGGFTKVKQNTFGGDKDVEVNTLLSGTIFSEEKAEELRKQHYTVRVGGTKNSDYSYFTMIPSFLDNASFDNTSVILGACSSAKTRTMVDKFRSKGASYVSGFERVTKTWVCSEYVSNMSELNSSSLSYQDAHYLSAKTELAKKVTEIVQGEVNKYPGEGLEADNYDLFNIASCFPEKPKEDFFFKSPYPVLIVPDENNPNFSWTCSLNPCSSLWYYYHDYYQDQNGEIAAYYNYFYCDFSVKYDLFIDGKLYKRTDDKSLFINNLSIGNHKAYVVAQILVDPEFEEKYPIKEISYKSNEVSFTVDELKHVKATTGVAQNVTSKNAVIPIVSEANWNPAIAQIGVVYSTTNSVPNIKSSDCSTQTAKENSIGSSSVQLTGLMPKTLYYYRAYILLESGDVFYGSVNKFTTAEEVKKPAISVDLSSLVFKDTKVGETSTASFKISNPGSANLTVSMSGASGAFSMNITSATIKPNEERGIIVTFTPDKADDFKSSIKISSNAGSDRIVSLNGKGIIVVEKTAQIEVSKTELSFPDVKIGDSRTIAFSIKNTGTADLKVSVSDPGAPYILSWKEKTISSDKTEILSVTFAPTEVSDYNAKLQINSNATNGIQFVTLTGNGIEVPDPDPQPDPQPASVSKLGVSITDVAFGSITVGQSGSQKITLSNSGDKALTIKNITVPNGFTVDWTSATIASKGSKILTVLFNPSAAQSYSGNLVIESDADNGTTKTLTIKGTGLAKPEPKLSVSTNNLDFGNQIQFASETRNITITNSGTGTLQITSITKTRDYGDLFTLSGWTSGGSIAAGASKTISVTFSPIEQRTYEETLTIVSSNATNSKTQKIIIRGTGIPEPENPVIKFSESDLSWGEIETGESLSKSFTVTNTGTTVLNISSIKIVASDNTQNPSYFTISPNTACSINPSKSKTFTVLFSPEEEKAYNALVSIKSNATNATQGTSTIGLSGTGKKATSKILAASPSSISFGMQTVGNRTHKNFTVKNTGTKAVSLYSMEASDGFIVDQTWEEGYSHGMAAGSSSTFSVYFSPTEVKSYTGQIVIKSNASNGDLIIPLSGTGAEEQGYLEITSGDNLDFGNVNLGASGTLSTRIKNTGDGKLNILGIDCPEGFSASCSVSSISAGYNATITVSFTPTQVKAYSGTITVRTDAENETVTIDVTGNGKQTSATTGFVDMGLSVKWAATNVGASKPEEAGHFVAWGETSTKTQYLYNNYKWYVADAYFSGSGYMIKYCNSPEPYGYQGFYNPLKMLTYDDDYAQSKLNGLARTPTRAEWSELKKNCDWVWTQENGVNGYMITSKITGNSIFLPACGIIEYSNKQSNETGYYWAEDLHYDEVYAYTWEIESDSYSSGYRERYKGLNVRAVEDNTAKPMIYFSDGKLSFPGTKIGTTASKNITISNIGKATLNISKVSTSKYFALSWTSATIEPGQSKTLTVSYTPVYNPDLVIDNDLTWDSTTLNITCDARNDNFNIYLEGYGVE